MITCSRCHAANPPGSDICLQCGASLLPDEGTGNRLVYLILGVFVAALLGFIAYLLLSSAAPGPIATWGAVGLIAVGVVFLILASFAAFRVTPESQRYALRAKRLEKEAPEQALADFSHALSSARSTDRLLLLEQHLQVAEQVGDVNAQIKDLAELKTAYMEAAERGRGNERELIAPQITSLFKKQEQIQLSVGETSLATQTRLDYLAWLEHHLEDVTGKGTSPTTLQEFLTDGDEAQGRASSIAQTRSILASQVTSERRRMMQGGTAAAVGYCPQCRQVYRLDTSLICPQVPNHGRLSMVKYTLPESVAEAEEELRGTVQFISGRLASAD